MKERLTRSSSTQGPPHFFSRRGPGVPCRRWCRPVEEARSQKGFHRRCYGGVRGPEQLADHVVGMQEEILHVASVTQVDGITTVSHGWQKPRASEGERVMYDELQQPFGVWKRAARDLSMHGWRCARLSLIWVRTKASDDQSKSAKAEVRESTSMTCCRTERCRKKKTSDLHRLVDMPSE